MKSNQRDTAPLLSNVIMISEPAPSHDKSPLGARCRACQLQLCKGRQELPHAALKESGDHATLRGGERRFTCQTCSITLVNSSDLAKPGWQHHRQ